MYFLLEMVDLDCQVSLHWGVEGLRPLFSHLLKPPEPFAYRPVDVVKSLEAPQEQQQPPSDGGEAEGCDFLVRKPSKGRFRGWRYQYILGVTLSRWWQLTYFLLFSRRNFGGRWSQFDVGAYFSNKNHQAVIRMWENCRVFCFANSRHNYRDFCTTPKVWTLSARREGLVNSNFGN